VFFLFFFDFAIITLTRLKAFQYFQDQTIKCEN